MHPDAVQRHHRPLPRKRGRTWWPPEPLVENVHDRTSRQPVVEVAQHDEQRPLHRLDILENLADLEAPLMDAQAEMCRQYVQWPAAHVERGRQRAPRLAPLDREVEPMHLDDRMAREKRVPEALHGVLTRRAERALVLAERREADRPPGFYRDGGRI